MGIIFWIFLPMYDYIKVHCLIVSGRYTVRRYRTTLEQVSKYGDAMLESL